MWVMMIKKLRTELSPPKLSFHWAVPWPDDKRAAYQKKLKKLQKKIENNNILTSRERKLARENVSGMEYLKEAQCWMDEMGNREHDWELEK